MTHNNQTLNAHNKERLLKHERGKERPSHILKGYYNMQVEKTKSHLKARIIKITSDFSKRLQNLKGPECQTRPSKYINHN